MKKNLIEHILSLVIVSAIFIALIVHFNTTAQQQQAKSDAVLEEYLQLDFLELSNPLHKSLLRETLNTYFPNQTAKNDSLVRAIDSYRAEQITSMQRQRRAKGITSPGKMGELFGMYLQFILAYVIVMLLTYYGVQTLATIRFVKYQQNHPGYLMQFWRFVNSEPLPKSAGALLPYLNFSVVPLIKAVLKAGLYFIMFSPAYVIAYAFKTRFDTDSLFFLVLLGVISNGLLITYAQKFYTFLLSESRKGYVQTAIVKSLHNNYFQHTPDGIGWPAIFRFNKSFPGHVFGHIYENANFQYMATIKEQASFLITGLVIIEMALNIQGHLCYELLQNLLFNRYDVALAIILGIFAVVKATEIFADYRISRTRQRFANE